MVKYILFFNEDDILRYNYYVEGALVLEPGIIEVNLKQKTAEIIKVAQHDSLKTFPVSDAKYLRDGMNEYHREHGEPEITDEELPLPKEDIKYYAYGSKAKNEIEKKIFENQEIPEKGTVIWY